MGEFEAIGDVVSGSVLGRAVEPKAGELGDDGHTHEADCLNCGTRLQGNFCHTCGQHAHVHRTLGAFFHDLLHSVLHFEGKTWRTLPLLVWRPGELTRRYIDGERARFVSPMALFLFSVFLMFAVIGLTNEISVPEGPEIQAGIKADIAKEEARLRSLEARLSAERASGRPIADIEAEMNAVRRNIRAEQDMAESGVIKGAAIQIDRELPGPLGKAIKKATDNPELFFYKLKTSAYKWSWALIPLSVPFLWLMFPFSRRFRVYDHMIFVTYSLCFMTMLACLGMILSATPLSVAIGVLVLVPPFHMFRQLRGAYGVGRFGALWRTVVLVTASFIVITGFIILLAGLGLFG